MGEIPILKYFFASTDKTQASDDIVFLIIPHIVRESILTDENTRAIYTGTSQSVELLRKAPGAAADGGELGGRAGGEFVAKDVGCQCGVVDDCEDGGR